MSDSRRLPAGQKWYIDPMQEIGYRADQKGVCYGVADKVIDAVLLRDVDTINKRFFLIDKINEAVKSDPTHETTFSKTIDTVKQKWLKLIEEAKASVLKDSEFIRNNAMRDIPAELDAAQQEEKINHLISAAIQERIQKKSQENLTEEERLTLDLPAFFEGVDIYFQGYRFHPIFEEDKRPLGQESILTAALASPALLEQKALGGRVRVGNFSGMYTPDDLILYLKSLHNTLQAESPFSEPFTLLLNNSNHALMIGFDPDKKKWIFSDPNHLPVKFLESDHVDKLANKILKGFFADENNPNVAISTEVFVAGKNKEKAESTVQTWQTTAEMTAMHRVTPERVQLVDKTGGSWLYSAIQRGDLETVKAILTLKTNDGLLPLIPIDTTLANGFRPLGLAAIYGHLDIAQFLLDQGADITKLLNKETVDETAFEAAITSGNLELVKLFVDRGALINEGSLRFAAQLGHVPILEELVKRGASLENDGFIALSAASEAGYLNAVKWLLSRGVDPNSSMPITRTPIFMAIKKGHEEIVAELLAHNVPVNQQINDNKQTLLHLAVENQHVSVVAALLRQSDLTPNQADLLGNTPLHLAAIKGNVDVFRILFNHPNVKADLKNNKNLTPFHAAIRAGQLEMVKFLIQNGAVPDELALKQVVISGNVDVFNELMKSGPVLSESILINAVGSSQLEMVNAILKYPIDINKGSKKYDGMTALQNAAAKGNLEAVKLLLDRGARLEQADNQQITALYYAVLGGSIKMVTELFARGAKINPDLNDQNEALREFLKDADFNPSAMDDSGTTLIHKAVREGDVALTELLISLPRANLSAIDKSKEAPVHIAADLGHIEILTKLIEQNDDLKNLAEERFGNTPLHIAARADNNAMVEFLVSQRAHPNFQNTQGYTPAHIAVEVSSIKMLKALMTLQPDLNIQNENGNTPLHLAVLEKNSPAMIEMLIKQGADPTIKNNDKGKTPIHIAIEKGQWEAAVLMLTSVKMIDADLQNSLQVHKAKLTDVLIRQLQQQYKNQDPMALTRLESVLKGENTFGKLLMANTASRSSGWSSMFKSKPKESPEIEVLRKLESEFKTPAAAFSIKNQ